MSRPGRGISTSRSTASQRFSRANRQRLNRERNMFSVIFEVHPKPDQWAAYFVNAKMLRPELAQVEGFVDNIRYRGRTREGWILSLSGWRDEKAVARCRTTMRDHIAQEVGGAYSRLCD